MRPLEKLLVNNFKFNQGMLNQRALILNVYAMKLFLIIFFLWSSAYGFGQSIECKYDVNFVSKKISSLPLPGMSTNIKFEILVLNDSKDNILMETILSEDNPSCYKNENNDNISMVKLKEKIIYSFDDNFDVSTAHYLSNDTLISTGKSLNYNQNSCQEYMLQNNSNVKVYASKDLSQLINPGINYYFNGFIGGIVRIVIETEKSNIVYQLNSVNKSAKNLDRYLSSISSYKKSPVETRSILKK